ncbi:hypothetical protein [Verminephrobacter eiseniae]|uniref:hypothetical protein n=2 Tax=Verminephrobacter eiseniae TaxID=364317 RepID=UPI002237C579|nr:hypothetical protein [Verminephrobacter eiseniae]
MIPYLVQMSVINTSPDMCKASRSGLATVKHHLDYVSRNGEVELTNESGESIQGRDELRALREQMKAKTLATWGQVAKNLEAAGQADLAKSVTVLMRDADKSTSSRTQELFDLAKARGKGKDTGQEL